jgi:alpha-1,3-glucosyltransferase
MLIVNSGNYLDPKWFALKVSRGLDDPDLKLYMRSTVLASEFLTYIPAVVLLVRKLARLEGISSFESYLSLTAILFLPSIILIDHGHFQYNTVMLGFAAASISALLSERVLLASFFFVGALGFKQMALFYAPAMFAYLLGKCVFPINITRLFSIAIITVLSFGLLFAPLLLSGMYAANTGDSIQEYSLPPLLTTLQPHLPFKIDQKNVFHIPLILLAQSIHRIFPFARGLFEDKVANFWCAVHTFHKLHQYSGPLVQKAALLGTLASILPPCLVLFLKPRRDLLLLGLAGCSWGFFLFSYQVHEKNVLLPLLPMSLVLATRGGLNGKSASSPSSLTRAWIGLANALGAFTMFPLLKRDGLTVPYFVLVPFWQWLLGLPPFSLSAYSTIEGGYELLTLALHLPFYLGMVAWHVAETAVPPPENKPDLWTVGNVLLGAAGFGLCYLWCVVELVKKSGIFGTAAPKRVSGSEKKTQ